MGKKLVKSKKLVGSGKQKIQMSAEDRMYWKRESKALAATANDFNRIKQSIKVTKSFNEIDNLLKESRALFDAHPSDSTARKLRGLREEANVRYKELGWTSVDGKPSDHYDKKFDDFCLKIHFAKTYKELEDLSEIALSSGFVQSDMNELERKFAYRASEISSLEFASGKKARPKKSAAKREAEKRDRAFRKRLRQTA